MSMVTALKRFVTRTVSTITTLYTLRIEPNAEAPHHFNRQQEKRGGPACAGDLKEADFQKLLGYPAKQDAKALQGQEEIPVGRCDGG